LQWEAVEEADRQVVVHQVALTEKVKQHIQVAEAVTLDHNHIQDQVEVVEEPR
tara:strand:+ start:402 stop:560 length:159 start_codon:yes stop_codon:yes gene_type:complete